MMPLVVSQHSHARQRDRRVRGTRAQARMQTSTGDR